MCSAACDTEWTFLALSKPHEGKEKKDKWMEMNVKISACSTLEICLNTAARKMRHGLKSA